MRQGSFIIEENTPLNGQVRRLRLAGDCSAVTAPGQFVSLRPEGCFLRRPFSVCDREGDRLTLVYRVLGQGTQALAELEPGASLDALTGLGRGFDLDLAGERPALLAGGLGFTPLFWLARRLRERGKPVTVLLGFQSGEQVLYEAEFAALGCETRVITQDGSRGERGLVTAFLPEEASCFYACGPEGMLRALCESAPCPGQLSLEARMGCGFGACMGCTVQTASGPRRVCKDGPVFGKEELLWQTQG